SPAHRGPAPMRSSLSDPASPSTLNFPGVTVSLMLTERASAPQDGALTRCAILTFNRHSNGGLGHEITERIQIPCPHHRVPRLGGAVRRQRKRAPASTSMTP